MFDSRGNAYGMMDGPEGLRSSNESRTAMASGYPVPQHWLAQNGRRQPFEPGGR
jgi:hypothetical protein